MSCGRVLVACAPEITVDEAADRDVRRSVIAAPG